MFGDSFTNGHGVEGDERFSWIVQNKCNTPVFNASYANGFSLEHYDYFIQHNTWLKPKVAIINLFASNDLGSDLNETLIDSKDLGTMSLPGRAISKSGNLISYLNIQNFPAKYALALAQHSSAARWLLEKIKAYQYKKASIPAANQQRSTNLSRDGILSSDARSRAVDSLLSISQNLLSRQEKSMVIVAMIPDSLTDLDANRMRASSKNIIAQLQHDINKKKPSNNISFVDMANHLDKSHFFKLDRHYNTLGHKTHAEQISKYLTENSTGACNE